MKLWKKLVVGFFGLASLQTSGAGQVLENQKFESLSGQVQDRFGSSIAIHDDSVLIGAPRLDTNSSAYLFSRSSGTQLFKFVSDNAVFQGEFGTSVALSDDYVLIGAEGEIVANKRSGAAYLYSRSSGALIRRLVPAVPIINAKFGISVALTADYAVVGAILDEDANGVTTGSVYLFSLSTLQQANRLFASDSQEFMGFGRALAADGDCLLVGSLGADNGAGAGYLFSLSSQTQLAKFRNPSQVHSGSFSWSVAIHDDHVVLGDPWRDGIYGGVGLAYLFSKSTGQLAQKLRSPREFVSQNFGRSVAVSSTRIVVGAPKDRFDNTGSGGAYVFSTSNGALLERLRASDGAGDDELGSALAIHQDRVAAGAPGADDQLGIETGSAYEFDVSQLFPPGDAYCFGDGSGAVCPCGAEGTRGAGCENTEGFGGARLTAYGRPSVANDEFRVAIDGMDGSTPGLLIRGADQVSGGLGNPVGDGLFCINGNMARSQVQLTFGSSTLFTEFQGLPFGAQSFGPGVAVRYQYWYRDPNNPCSGAGFNFSNAWEVVWTP